MYLNDIRIVDFRSFRKVHLDLCHRDRRWSKALPEPKLPNMNLLLGENGSGKTTLLKAIALACLGPAVSMSGLFPYRLIRQSAPGGEARVDARFHVHAQDVGRGPLANGATMESAVRVLRRGDIEQLEWVPNQDSRWNPIFERASEAFFFVGYGATRRTEQKERFDASARQSRVFARAQRIQGLFDESWSLTPLSAWLPHQNPGRHKQVLGLINRLLGPDQLRFDGEMQDGEYVFRQGTLRIPFPALSDGYRTWLAWLSDLLYHVVVTCPDGKKLVENRGIVMLDEIDLHLHPRWQQHVLPSLAACLPNLQFVVTSHSPLLVSSLDWANVLVMSRSTSGLSTARRVQTPVHALDADQLLQTDLFGLQTTRSGDGQQRLDELTARAVRGDAAASLELLRALSATGIHGG